MRAIQLNIKMNVPPSMIEATDATRAICPFSSRGSSPLMILTGAKKLTFMTACNSYSPASQLKAGNIIPALYSKKSIFLLCSLIFSISLSTAARSERSQRKHSQIPFSFLISFETSSKSSFLRSTRIIVEWYCLAIQMAISLPMPMHAPTITTMLSEFSFKGFGRFNFAYRCDRAIRTITRKARKLRIVYRVEKLMQSTPIGLLRYN